MSRSVIRIKFDCALKLFFRFSKVPIIFVQDDAKQQVATLVARGDRQQLADPRFRTELASYLAGVNEYIAEARIDPSKMPGEYAAINDLDGPDDFVPADVVATAAVAGAIFGVGGGAELKSAPCSPLRRCSSRSDLRLGSTG